jgi:maleylacetoacetate isomerase
MTMLLYTYFRSSAAYRVRIAINYKEIAVEQRFVNIAPAQSEQLLPAYGALNPQRLIPLLRDGDFVLSQSQAILEYLEELRPAPPLLPADARGRARVRALAAMVCCDIHPLQNLRVQRYLGEQLGCDQPAVQRWIRHFIEDGLRPLEQMLASDPLRGEFCHGSTPSLADVCLVPQLYNAVRYGCDIAQFPVLIRIRDACLQLPAFRDAAPERQPDAV